MKEATVERFHDQTTDELHEPLPAFWLAYHHAKRWKTLRGLTPHEVVCAQWQKIVGFFCHWILLANSFEKSYFQKHLASFFC